MTKQPKLINCGLCKLETLINKVGAYYNFSERKLVTGKFSFITEAKKKDKEELEHGSLSEFDKTDL